MAADICRAIKNIMKIKGVSQAELAKRLGVSKQRVNYLLNEQNSMSFESADKILQALGCRFRIEGVNTSVDPQKKVNKSVDLKVNSSIDSAKSGVNSSVYLSKDRVNTSVDNRVNKSVDVNTSVDPKVNTSVDNRVNKSVDVNTSVDPKVNSSVYHGVNTSVDFIKTENGKTVIKLPKSNNSADLYR